MAKTLHACIYPSAPTVIVERRMIDLLVDAPPNKRALWRPVEVAGDDAFDPLTQKKTGPLTTIEANRVLDTYTISSLSAQEISDRKDAAVNALNGTERKALLTILLAIANDNRAIKRKINAVIAAAGLATPVFPAGQATTPANDWTETDLKAYIKGLLT